MAAQGRGGAARLHPAGRLNLRTAHDYLNFVTRFILAFGLAFLLPVFLVALNLVGVLPARVDAQGLAAGRLAHLRLRGDHDPDARRLHDALPGDPDGRAVLRRGRRRLPHRPAQAPGARARTGSSVPDDEASRRCSVRRLCRQTRSPCSSTRRRARAGARPSAREVARLAARGRVTRSSTCPASDAAGAATGRRAAIAARRRRRSPSSAATAWCTSASTSCAGPTPPLGVVAAGTGNDFARDLGLPVRDAAAAVGAASTGGDAARIDAGRVHATATAGRALVRSACSAPASTPSSTSAPTAGAGRRGQMRYNLAVAARAAGLPADPVRRRARRARGIETRAMLVAVANGPSYGGGMQVCPDADARRRAARRPDPARDRRSPAFLRVFPKVFAGAHVAHPAVEIAARRGGSAWRRPASSPTPTASGSPPLPIDVRGRARRAARRSSPADVA